RDRRARRRRRIRRRVSLQLGNGDRAHERSNLEKTAGRWRSGAGVPVDLDARDIDRHRAVNVLRRHRHSHRYLVTATPRLDLLDGGRDVHDRWERRALFPAAHAGDRERREKNPNSQLPTPKPLPTPNFQLPTTPNWQLGVGSGW